MDPAPDWPRVLVKGLPLLIALWAFLATACAERGPIVVRSLKFTGLEAASESRLRAVLITRQGSGLPWGRRQYFDRARFDADLKRIVAFYTDRGYPDARVTGFDVKVDEERNAVDISVGVERGEPVLVSGVEFRGFEVVPADRLERMRQQAPLVIEKPRDRQVVLATRDSALNLLREHGYPYARVSVDERAGRTGKQAALTFGADPGPLARFGSVEIVGNQSVGSRVIDRQLSYRPGEIYRRSAVQESQRRLLGMALFQFVNIEALNPEQRSPEVRTRVTVAEGRHQRVNFGAGYGTEEKARVDGEYHHVNFLGGARSAGVHARWSSLDRGIRLDFNQPYFFGPHVSAGAEAQQWYTDTPAYRSVVTGGKVTVVHRGSPATSWSMSMLSERNSSAISDEALDDPTLRGALIALGLDPTTGRQEGTLNAIGLDLQRSTANNVLNASRGYQLALHVEQAGRLLPGAFRYFAISGDARHYLPLGERLVLASRLQAATIDAAANDPGNVPFSKKYFLGGATSIRGWGRYEVGPLSESGLPIGGNSLFAWSTELRATLVRRLDGAVFLDAGNVWADGWTVDFGDLRYSGGAGIRYQTPVGPVRLDVGYQLNPIEGLTVNGEPQRRHFRLHFSIGQAF